MVRVMCVIFQSTSGSGMYCSFANVSRTYDKQTQKGRVVNVIKKPAIWNSRLGKRAMQHMQNFKLGEINDCSGFTFWRDWLGILGAKNCGGISILLSHASVALVADTATHIASPGWQRVHRNFGFAPPPAEECLIHVDAIGQLCPGGQLTLARCRC